MTRHNNSILFSRIIDLVFSIIFLICLSPILIICAVLLVMLDGTPILFKQKRLGKGGKIFVLYKFKTMVIDNKRANVQVFSNSDGVTRIGSWLRRFKIDELPQLFNILKGDMSFVGPRPCLPDLAEKFDNNGEMRLKVKPGLSGLAQINGNIHLSWPERWEYDAEYVRKKSIWLDIKIVFKTILIVLLGEKKFINKK